MVLHKIESIDHYVKYLQETPNEVQVLFDDMLINVTGFFRDPQLFDVLKQKVFPRLVEGKPAAPLAEKKSAATGKEANPAEPTEVEREVERLRYELASTKETLQMVVEEHESANEELRAANEEIQSSNEELQSTNEELETAKEELQSTNEELTTVNDELENRNIQLSQAMSDLHNLLNSVNIPVVMLDPDMRIRSFTPLAQRVLKLIPADAGRPIGELKLGIQAANLEAQIMDVIENLNTKEQEVQVADGCWYSMRIRPVRTADQRIVGAVLTLLDITAQRVALRDAQVLAEQIVTTIREPLLILDAHLRVPSANPAFYKTFQVTAADTENRLLYELGNRQWDIPGLRTLLEEIIPRHSQFEDFRVDHDFPGIGRKKMLLNAGKAVRFDLDGHSDAQNERLRGYRVAPPARLEGAHRGLDRPRPGRRPRQMPGGGLRRLHRQAHHRQGIARRSLALLGAGGSGGRMPNRHPGDCPRIHRTSPERHP
jgi:PAS domain-containing protein